MHRQSTAMHRPRAHAFLESPVSVSQTSPERVSERRESGTPSLWSSVRSPEHGDPRRASAPESPLSLSRYFTSTSTSPDAGTSNSASSGFGVTAVQPPSGEPAEQTATRKCAR